MEKNIEQILTNSWVLIPILLLLLINTFFNLMYFVDYVIKENNKNKKKEIKQILKEIKENENNNNNTND